MSSAGVMSTPTDWLPVTVKLLSCGRVAAAQRAGDADALPDQEGPDGEDLGLEDRPLPPRQIAAVPGGPVDEEE